MLLFSLVYSGQHCMQKSYVSIMKWLDVYNVSQPFMYMDMCMHNCMIVHEYCFYCLLQFHHLLQVPPKVTGVSVSKALNDGNPSLRVTWTALQNVANLSDYHVQYRRNGELFWGNSSTVSVQDNSTSILLPALLPGTEYNVRVKAVSAAGEGEWSEVHTEATYNSEFIHLHVPLCHPVISDITVVTSI